ncbi:MAG: M10 family metallopeptidase C-terminal domain-containing protein [Paracoccaceae bacterium]
MATTVISSSSGGSGKIADIAFRDNLILSNDTRIYSDDSEVIIGVNFTNIFLSPGSSVFGFSQLEEDSAIELGSDQGGSNELVVSETATVFGEAIAISLFGGFNTVINNGTVRGNSAIDAASASNFIENNGTITGAVGVTIGEFRTGTLVNNGKIDTTLAGVSFNGSDFYNTGQIISGTAVFLGAGGNLFNLGVISGIFQGVVNTEDSVLIENSGTIRGSLNAISLIGESSRIINSGLIVSGANSNSTINYSHITLDPSDPIGESRLVNSGEITSQTIAIIGNNLENIIENTGLIQGDVSTKAENDTINSSGQIQGDVDLGDGADVYRLTGTGQTSGVVTAGAGDDVVQGGMYEDYINGGEGEDRMRGQGGDDSLTGGGQIDTIWGGSGDDTVRGDGGSDLLFGDGGSDLIDGGNGRDKIYGASGDDTLIGGGSDDLLSAGSGDDSLRGGSNNDTLKGGSGDDTLEGGSGVDLLQGGSEDDLLLGEDSADTLQGGRGADTLNGGADADVLSGGQDADVFEFLSASDTSIGAEDVITDFSQGLDHIDLSAMALDFVGTDAFSGGGQASVRFVRINADDQTEIRIDANGDGLIDAQIDLTGAMTLIAGDFIL